MISRTLIIICIYIHEYRDDIFETGVTRLIVLSALSHDTPAESTVWRRNKVILILFSRLIDAQINIELFDRHKYKEIQIRIRQIVERTFGVWKRRFPCLTRGLTTKFLCSTTTVVACAVLHNSALIFNDILVEEDEIENQNESVEELLGNVENVNGIDGFTTRFRWIY